MLNLDRPVSQADFAALVGVTESAISQAVSEGRLEAGATGRRWLLAYCDRLREQAAGRGSDGPLSLVDERAALARAQRMRVEIDVAEAQKRLIPAALVEPKWRAACVAAREQLLRARRRLVERLGRCKTPKERDAAVGEEHEAFLRTLAQWRGPEEEAAA